MKHVKYFVRKVSNEGVNKRIIAFLDDSGKTEMCSLLVVKDRCKSNIQLNGVPEFKTKAEMVP